MHNYTLIKWVLYIMRDSFSRHYLRASTVVKKAVTIPDWLIKRAEKEGIDLSGTLVEALKEKLGV